MFIKNYNRLLLILILLLFLTQYTNFYKNLKNIYFNNYEKRIANIYGFCGRNSLGFLLYIKEKYKLENYPEIVNYKIKPSPKWVFDLDGKHKSADNFQYLIILNYQQDLKINLPIVSKNFYKIPNQENNTGIKSIKIKLDEGDNSQAYDINIKLIQSNFKDINVIYHKNFNNVLFKNKEAEVNLNFQSKTLQDRVSRSYILIESNKLFFQANNINMIFYNKHQINKERIIEKEGNCYFIKK
jgi:hypothetical protein